MSGTVQASLFIPKGNIFDNINQPDYYEGVYRYLKSINDTISNIKTGADSGTGDYKDLQSSINNEAALYSTSKQKFIEDFADGYAKERQEGYANAKLNECEDENEGNPEAFAACSDGENQEKWLQEGYNHYYQDILL